MPPTAWCLRPSPAIREIQMKQPLPGERLLSRPPSEYTLRLACCAEDVRLAQALRFEVFNLELGEGLEASHATGLDADAFDGVCDHLLVEHPPTGQVVGTYRLQMGSKAASALGYYSAQEFDLGVFEPARAQVVELGRACVHQEHRSLAVVGLLWKGIADYATERGGRYLCGCSSLTSQDPAVGASVYAALCRKYLVAPPWRVKPWPAYECPMDHMAPETPPVPKLLRAYLQMGAKICGPPALDRQFKTIDFLTFMDLDTLASGAKARFFGVR